MDTRGWKKEVCFFAVTQKEELKLKDEGFSQHHYWLLPNLRSRLTLSVQTLYLHCCCCLIDKVWPSSADLYSYFFILVGLLLRHLMLCFPAGWANGGKKPGSCYNLNIIWIKNPKLGVPAEDYTRYHFLLIAWRYAIPNTHCIICHTRGSYQSHITAGHSKV